MRNCTVLVALLCSLLAVAVFSEGLEEPHPATDAPKPEPHPVTEAPTRAPVSSPTAFHGAHHNPPVHPSPPVFEPKYTAYELANLNVTRTLYDGLLFPSAANIIAAGVYPAGIFNANASGRITPVGEFDDQIGSFEYFYGLASVVDMIQANFIKLFARDNEVSIRVDLLVNQSSVSVQGFQNVTQTGFITFDSDSRILSYDLAILRLGQATVIPPVAYPSVIVGICQVHSAFCLGANQQYANYNSCISEITTFPFGTWDNLASNTTACRQLHSALVPRRPDIHCPHIGPTGGNACIDLPYAEWYQVSY